MSSTIDRPITAKRQLAVDLYPTIGRRAPGEPAWQVAVHGRIVRPWHDNLQRRLVMKLLRQTMKIDFEDIQSDIFQERMDPFWVKPCRRRRVHVQVEGAVYPLRKRSRGSGHFHAAIRVPFALSRHTDSQPGSMVLATENGRAVDPSATIARLIPPCGTSVISDIDDTIKESEVFDRRQMFRNTFLNPYQPVDGMAGAYCQWAAQGCEFHYVSSSPWQLYRPLELFLNEHGFPPGSFHLRAFRLRDPNNFQLMTAGVRSKRKAIRSLLKWYPFRQFVLIGDGGQKDAKLYAKMAKKHGHQIAQICIRKLPAVSGYTEREVRHALRELPPSKWRLFEHGGELTDLQAGSHLGWTR
jgi:phosphatidate phosphatase APP1